MDPVVRVALDELGANPTLDWRHLSCCHEKDVVVSYLVALREHGHRYDIAEVMAWFCSHYGMENCSSVRRWVEAVAWGGRPGPWTQQFLDVDEVVARWEEEALVPA